MYFIGKSTILLYFLILFTPVLLAQEEPIIRQNLVAGSDITVKKTLPDINFAAVGDFGCGDEANRTVNNIITKNPRLVLALGDLSYSGETGCWFKLVSPFERNNIALRIVVGSHDIGKNSDKYDQYLNHFKMDKPYYSFDYQNLHFLGMTTGKESLIPYDNASDQYQFVKNDLEKTHGNSNIDWIIVFGFTPLYSTFTVHSGDGDLRDLYHPLFNKYGIDLVIQAHNHNYQRTYPLLYNEHIPSKPIITDKNKEKYSNPKGEIFLTVGTAGADLHNLTGQKPFIVKQFDDSHGFLNIDITNNGKKLISTFYENRELSVKDRFTVIKN
ncbi:MAG: hypothetical protein E6L03_00370 [Thaumarchaeota archaeon]|nr:MAG: hypothetical protein E6L03_00370 [Nitrososphaerota archaeon]